MTPKQAPLYIRSHDLAIWLQQRTASWSSTEVKDLAVEISKNARNLLQCVSLALTFPDTRENYRRQADETIVRLKVLLTLAKDLGAISPRQLRFAQGELIAMGRMIGGWRKKARMATSVTAMTDTS